MTTQPWVRGESPGCLRREYFGQDDAERRAAQPAFHFASLASIAAMRCGVLGWLIIHAGVAAP